MKRAILTTTTIDVATELTVHDRGGHGATASFVGRVRGDDGVTELMLEHHPVMTTAALEELAAGAQARWALDAVTVIHRIGAMAPGETIVLVLASSAHRDAALAAATFLIDRLKTDVPLWKRETLADGAVRWVEPRANDEARAAGWEQHTSAASS
jgi:molybdopterin synthase catalytic subunit